LYEKLNVKNNKEGFANKGETIKQCNRCINMLSMLSLSVDEIPNTPKIVNRLGRLEEKSLSDGIRLLAHGNTIISHYNKRVKEGVIPFDNLTINCVNLYDHEQLVEIGNFFFFKELSKFRIPFNGESKLQRKKLFLKEGMRLELKNYVFSS
jgi:hypothetical protein